MKIIYRISENGYNKIKPSYINNENCLKNCIEVFPDDLHDWTIIADNVSENTLNMIKKYVKLGKIYNVSIGNGAGTFRFGLDIAFNFNDSDIVYFIENDYLHINNSDTIINEGLSIGADFVSLYDHPDKYIESDEYIGGGELTRVFLSHSCHWKLTNSTTMTFATTVKTLKEYIDIIKYYTKGTHPHDYDMWLKIRERNGTLITPLPSYSTHGETAWLAPLINWKTYANSNTQS